MPATLSRRPAGGKGGAHLVCGRSPSGNRKCCIEAATGIDRQRGLGMTRCGSLALLLAAITLVGCKQARPPGVYDVPVGEAFRRLSTDQLPDLVFAKQCGILIHVMPEGVTDQEVTWRVFSSDQEVVQFTATLTP